MVIGWSNYSSLPSTAVPKLLSTSTLATEDQDLELVCSSVAGLNIRNKASYISRSSASSSLRLKFNNALESLLDRASSALELPSDKTAKRIFSYLLSGAGIAEVTGPSGSGKTSFCMHLINSAPKLTLYIDASGSYSPDRATSPECIICLRVFNCEELDAVLSDLKRLLLEDGYLPVSKRIPARSIRNLIVDSLWPVLLLENHQKANYLLRLCSTLRDISWKYNITVIVCSNSSKLENLTPRGNRASGSSSHNNWRSRCYVQISLERNTHYSDGAGAHAVATLKQDRDRITHSGAGILGCSGVVRRFMNIISGSDYCSRRYEFGIDRHRLVLYEQ